MGREVVKLGEKLIIHPLTVVNILRICNIEIENFKKYEIQTNVRIIISMISSKIFISIISKLAKLLDTVSEHRH